MGDRTTAADAAEAFARARRRAGLRSLLRVLGRGDDPLLSYDDVRRRLHAVEGSLRVREDVPLDAIVGSVGRYNDFTREFLPKVDSDRDRWVGVRLAMDAQVGIPPVELYRIGDAYFVRDGNHRVSVARQLGAPTIEAYVTPVHARVPLSPLTGRDELIVAQEHARFLEETALDELRPDADVRLTAPGGYGALREHISVHRYFMGLERGAEVDEREAASHWYDEVYCSVVGAIRASGVLRDFPGLSEADLYLWLSEHRGRLADDIGFAISSESIADRLSEPHRLTEDERAEVLERLRRMRPEGRSGEVALVHDVLVVVDQGELGGHAVDQAATVASLEGASLYGLHVAPDEPRAAGGGVAALRARFVRACQAAGVEGQFAVAVGAARAHVRERLPWFDLVVLPLVGASGSGGPRVHPAHGTVLRRSRRPILVVTGPSRRIGRALVAFDGSATSEEALFAGAYLALKWDVALVIAVVADGRGARAEARDAALGFLARFGLTADAVELGGPASDALAPLAVERACDLIVIASRRSARVLESVVGGVVVRTLLAGTRPVLVV